MNDFVNLFNTRVKITSHGLNAINRAGIESIEDLKQIKSKDDLRKIRLLLKDDIEKIWRYIKNNLL